MAVHVRQANLSSGFSITNPLPVTVSPNPLPVIGSIVPGTAGNPNVLEVAGQSNDGFGTLKTVPIPVSLDGLSVPISGSVDLVSPNGRTAVQQVGIAAPSGGVGVLAEFLTVPPVIANGQTALLQSNSSGALKVDGSAVTQPISITAGQAVQILDSGGVNKLAISGSGVLTVQQTTPTNLQTLSRVTGNIGGVFDAQPPATSTNALGVYSKYANAAPAVANNASSFLQSDSAGSLLVKTARRGQVISQATTIASSAAATTIIAAGAASTFRDITKIFISVVSLAAGAAPISFTATLSDGTSNYIFDMQADQLGTGVLISNPSPPLNLDFNPPLSATTAATAWTITLSVATVTVHITAVALQGLAS
jgi:hypothetical protein